VCRGACAGVFLVLTLAWCMPASAAQDALADDNVTLTALEPATTVADDAQAEPAPPDPAAPAPPDPGTTPAPTGTIPAPDLTAGTTPAPDPTATVPPDPISTPATSVSAPGTGTGKGDTANALGNKKQNPQQQNPQQQNPTPDGSTSGTTKTPPATAPDTPAGKDPSSTATRPPSADAGARPPADAEEPAPQPAATPSQPDVAVPRAPSTPIGPPPVLNPAVLAHRLEPTVAPRAALAPEHVARRSKPSDAPVMLIGFRTVIAFRTAVAGSAATPAPSFTLPAPSPETASPGAPAAGTQGKAHRNKPPRVSRPAPQRAPRTPSAPPDRGPVSVAGSAASSSGGVPAAMWCAVLLGIWLCAAGDLRRHRGRLLLAGPAGVPSPQQRPG
jgi:hypothetical protein